MAAMIVCFALVFFSLSFFRSAFPAHLCCSLNVFASTVIVVGVLIYLCAQMSRTAQNDLDFERARKEAQRLAQQQRGASALAALGGAAPAKAHQRDASTAESIASKACVCFKLPVSWRFLSVCTFTGVLSRFLFLSFAVVISGHSAPFTCGVV